MNLSVRFGIALIGLGVVLLGLYMQKKSIQGFQVYADTGTRLEGKPPVPSPETVNPEIAAKVALAATPPPITVDDIDVLVAKDKEIRSKMNMIIKNKPSSDVILLNYIGLDHLTNLDLMFNEVFQYIKTVADVPALYSKNTEQNKHTIRQIIYTASDQTDMLYNIYFTIPSSIIATDSIVISDTVTADAINNPHVIAEASKQISAILSTLPSPGSKLNTYLTNVMNSVSKLSASSGPVEMNSFTMNLAQYLDTLDVQIKNVHKNTQGLNNLSMTNNVSDDKIKEVTKIKSSFLSTSITSLQSIQASIEKSQSADSKVANALSDIKSRITSLQAGLTAMKPPPVLEKFASIMNPYDEPSPSVKQAREFGLGRRAYIDEIFSGIKLF